jgi:hypothetical protein
MVDHEVLEYVKKVAETNKKTIEKGTILFRARLFTGETGFLNHINRDWNEKEELDSFGKYMKAKNKHAITSRNESGFWGYDEKDSFVPEDNKTVGDGRANPPLIRYLYTAEKPYTALVEVRPYLDSLVSIAEIRVNDDIHVADFSYDACFWKLRRS